MLLCICNYTEFLNICIWIYLYVILILCLIIFRSDMKSVALVLAHASNDDVNTPVSPRDSRSPLHLAASLGNLAIAQLLIWVSVYFWHILQNYNYIEKRCNEIREITFHEKKILFFNFRALFWTTFRYKIMLYFRF